MEYKINREVEVIEHETFTAEFIIGKVNSIDNGKIISKKGMVEAIETFERNKWDHPLYGYFLGVDEIKISDYTYSTIVFTRASHYLENIEIDENDNIIVKIILLHLNKPGRLLIDHMSENKPIKTIFKLMYDNESDENTLVPFEIIGLDFYYHLNYI